MWVAQQIQPPLGKSNWSGRSNSKISKSKIKIKANNLKLLFNHSIWFSTADPSKSITMASKFASEGSSLILMSTLFACLASALAVPVIDSSRPILADTDLHYIPEKMLNQNWPSVEDLEPHRYMENANLYSGDILLTNSSETEDPAGPGHYNAGNAGRKWEKIEVTDYRGGVKNMHCVPFTIHPSISGMIINQDDIARSTISWPVACLHLLNRGESSKDTSSDEDSLFGHLCPLRPLWSKQPSSDWSHHDLCRPRVRSIINTSCVSDIAIDRVSFLKF